MPSIAPLKWAFALSRFEIQQYASCGAFEDQSDAIPYPLPFTNKENIVLVLKKIQNQAQGKSRTTFYTLRHPNV